MKRFKIMALAALVAFAACDEGTDVVVTPDVTGDIAGVVTIEGVAVQGVSVALSSGETTTTDASGAYAFHGIPAGAYTITISGFAADATFSSTSKAASIVSTGQVATVNFDGAYIRTSAVLGSVVAGGKGLAGVDVSIGDATKQTDANGQYSFSGLRAGTYTVTVSGFNTAQYAFATSSQEVTVGVGESKVVAFNGQLLATSTISGTLYVDGNTNLSKDVGEPAVAKAGITVSLETAIGDTLTTTTDANGMYSFADLDEGNYKVILLPQAALPGAFAPEGADAGGVLRYLAAATSGAATTVDLPFTVATQYVDVYGMLGLDGKTAGVGGPIPGWTVALYPTEVDATASTNALNTTAVKTGSDGKASFSFARTADYSPNAKVADGIVFAKVTGAPSADYTMNGEAVIEIPWLPMDSLVMAPDTFDALYGKLVVKVRSEEIDFDTLAGWTFEMRSDKDSVGGGSNTWTNFSDANGDLVVPIDLALLASIRGGTAVTYPDTLWFKLAGFQAGANGLTFKQIPAASEGTAHGSFLRYIWDGTHPAGDTLMLGAEQVQYTQVNLKFRVHREQDDSLGFSSGDGFGDAPFITASTYKVSGSTKTLVSGPTAAEINTGLWTVSTVAAPATYEIRARSTHGGYDVLNDTVQTELVTGKDQDHYWNQLKGTAGYSTFMYKANTNSIGGMVGSRLGASGATGLIVTVTPAAGNIQGTAMKADTTGAGGTWSVTGLREGAYDVSVSAGDSAWTFLRTLKTTSTPTSGAANNASATTAARDLEGYGVVGTTNFEAYRTDVTFSGRVTNDLDSDGLNDVAQGESLAGATMNLYMDDDTKVPAGTDTLAATTTTDANGDYTFTGLREGRYTVKWVTGSPSTDYSVQTALTAANVPTITVTGTTVFNGPVKNTAATLPTWNYATSTGSNLTDANFVFLANNTQVIGTAKTAGAVAVANLKLTAKRCYTATMTALTKNSGPVPAVAGAGGDNCITYFTAPASWTATTDSTGAFTFSGLTEGVYEVTPDMTSVTPTYTTSTPAAAMYVTVGASDVETFDFVIS